MNRRTEPRSEEVSCDAVVIGSGAGGATIASELLKAGFDVLVVEEGSSVNASDVPDKLSTSFSQMWRSGGMTLAAGRPPIAYAEGKCVGGSTEINSSIFQIPPEELISAWGKNGSLKSFTPESMHPLYERASKLVNASTIPGALGAH